MVRQQPNSQRPILQMIAAGFVISFLLNIIALFFPVDMNANPPHYAKETLLLQSLSTAMLIFSSTILSMKLTEEKKTLSSGGFAMYAIANGIGLVTFFEMRQFTLEESEKIYDIYTSEVALLIPAILLIIFYEVIPKWLRYLPLLNVASMLATLALYYSGYKKFNVMDEISFFGYMLMNLVHLLWGIFIWKQSRQISATTS